MGTKFRVQRAKVIWLSIEVEAEDEAEAQEIADSRAPKEFCAHCLLGYDFKQHSISDDDPWLPLSEFYEHYVGANYKPDTHGHDVQAVSQ